MLMTITADQVRELRNKTSAGLMACKNALNESEGDFEKAVEILRKKGIVSAAKREGKDAKEGLIGVTIEGSKGVMVELNCETDFVAKTDGYTELLNNVIAQVSEKGEAVLKEESFKTFIVENAAKTGEKVEVGRASVVEATNGFVASYLHPNKRVGVLVAVEGDSSNEELQSVARDVAMQVAAMKPLYVTREEVPADWVQKEKDILLDQSKDALAGKPEEVQQKILEGKIGKKYEEICLLNQKFIKEDKLAVGKYVENAAKKAGGSLKVVSFVRFELGA
jgi:elongation factor Ts